MPIPWSDFGSQDDLHISGEGTAGIDFTTATILFDGAPAPNCSFDAEDVSCANVPHDTSTVTFSYGMKGGPATLTLEVYMSNDVCLATYPPCEE